ncbi:unnamed protein product [Pieris brassicae]|uniref:Uncharacterized protein n=1 Tax=Pieris brassicae TaxID=7116 RepID=A0A9P0SXE8_PIEBR|nr:unnamed protein product [Pieris brassicae]
MLDDAKRSYRHSPLDSATTLTLHLTVKSRCHYLRSYAVSLIIDYRIYSESKIVFSWMKEDRPSATTGGVAVAPPTAYHKCGGGVQ